MSENCIRCVKNERTGYDLLCDQCRNLETLHRKLDKLLVKIAEAAYRAIGIDDVKITLVIRQPDNKEGDIVLSDEDTLDAPIAALGRRKGCKPGNIFHP